jgi:conjugal transfer ATP-binding protein TraC
MENELNGKDSKGIQGIFGRIKEAFRGGTQELGDALLRAQHNPSSRSELFPYRFFDENTGIYYLDEQIGGFIYECDALVGIDGALYKQISMLFDDLMPEDGVIDVLLLASDNLSQAIDRWRDKRVMEEDIYRKLESYRQEFFKEYNKQRDVNFKHRDYRLFISYSNNLDKKKGAELIIKFQGRLKTILGSFGCNPRLLKPKGFIGLIQELVNYPDFKEPRYRELDSISDQICDISNALLVTEEGVMMGGDEYITRVYELIGYPEEFSIGKIPLLLGDIDSDSMQIPSRFAIIYSISNEIKSGTQEAFKKKGEMVVKQAGGYLEKFNRVLKEEGKEWNQIIERNLKNKERFLRTSFLAMITARPEAIEYTEQSLMSLWRKYDFTIKALNNFHLPGLMSFCPFLNKTGLGRLMKSFGIKRTVMSSEPKALLPIHAEWKGSDMGGMILTGRRGQVFAWNNFYGANNYNACVIGETGSGKSVFLQELVMSHLAQGTRVFVVDIGRSFEKTCKIMKGDFLSFGSSSKTCLNPFSTIPDDEGEYDPKAIAEDEERPNLVQDSLNYLKKIVQKMSAPMYGTTDIQNASIAYALYEVWSKYKSDANIDRLIEILESKGEREKDLALMLFEFSSKGNYGKFFNGKDNVRFDNQLTVLEFEELREQPELGGVIMQMLAVQIVQQVYLGDRSQKFIILFDEAWYALENFPLFLASMAKTVRKYNGGLVLGTQSLEHFYGSSDASDVLGTARRSVAGSCGWRVMMRQSPDSSESLTKMSMPEELISMVKSLNTVKGEYSEMLIYQSETNYFISRLMLDKFSQILYSSSPEVFSRVQQYLKQGMDTAKAVETVMNEVYKA